jgi:predicted nuclease of predicted toxin-antitoxin system
MQDQRIVISKDSDFYKHFVLHREPWKLIMVTTGNINNQDLIQIFEAGHDSLFRLLAHHWVVELNPQTLVVHF